MNSETEQYYAKLMGKASKRIAALEAELAATTAAQREPIAMIGMGCRFPGAENPAAFWQLLRNGTDVIREVPPERWDVDAYYDPDPDRPGKVLTRAGGFLDQPIDEFDAHFFGVSAREAVGLDPQQRLLLEVTWEALEDAALPPDTLPKNTGVFLGISTNEYLQHLLQRGEEQIDAYLDTGNAFATACGRISYLLNVHGPCIAIETACSSSLVAVHQACQSLRQQRCDLALTGGVGLLLSPIYTINFSRARMLAPDGRCKTFDAAADGFARGEGCGMVVLKRLSDAEAAGDPILAVIRGTAINQDGRTSSLTVPNGPAQQAVIRQALADGGLDAAEVSYIEAHGTGTALGDPIEIGALGAVFGEREQPLYVGSVKTNMGHLEASAGIAGLIKVVLSLHHGVIPPHLHFHQPSPRIDWDQLSVAIPTALTPWPAENRVAGVSSFGFSGTNAHVVVESFRRESRSPESIGRHETRDTRHEIQDTRYETGDTRHETGDGRQGARGGPLGAQLLTLSAQSETALRALVERYVGTVTIDTTMTLADICATAQSGRAHFSHRLGITTTTHDELHQQLSTWLAGDRASGVVQGVASEEAARIAFLFTGQGSQYVDMGRELYATNAAFRATLDHCDALLQQYLGESVVEILYPGVGDGRRKTGDTRHETRGGRREMGDTQHAGGLGARHPLDDTTYTQPALFALEYALAQLWLAWGVKPDVVMGHSVGEVVAACVAGVFSLEDGLKLIAARGRLMGALPASGAMVAVAASAETVTTVIDSLATEVTIAAYNTPTSVVLSGASDAVEHVVAILREQGIETKSLTVSHAFHSPLMEPMLRGFAKVAQSIAYHPPQIPIISNVTGQLTTQEIATPTYWVQHVRQPVRFAGGVLTSQQQGIDIYLEIGPKPTLLGMVGECLERETEDRKQKTKNRKQKTENGRRETGDAQHTTHNTQYAAEHQGSQPPCLLLPSLRPNRSGIHSDWQTLLTTLGQLYTHGAAIDWSGLQRANDPIRQRRRVALPTYPFQRQRFWAELPDPKAPPRKMVGEMATPMLHRLIQSPLVKETIGETAVNLETMPYLTDHRIFGEVVVPGAAYLTTILSAAGLMTGQVTCCLEDVIFPQALTIPEDETRTLQLVLTPETDGTDSSFAFQLISLGEEAGDEQSPVHALGQLITQVAEARPAQALANLQASCPHPLASDVLYAAAQAQAITFGPTFRWLDAVWCGPGVALARLRQPATLGNLADHTLHPCLLDACFQLTVATSYAQEHGQSSNGQVTNETLLPFAVASLQCYATAHMGEEVKSLQLPEKNGTISRGDLYEPYVTADQQPWWAYAKQTGDHRWDIQLLNNQGEVLVALTGFEERAVPQPTVQVAQNSAAAPLEAQHSNAPWRDWLYAVQWQPTVRWTITGDDLPTPRQLQQALQTTVEDSLTQPDLQHFQRGIHQLEAICLDYVLMALAELGIAFVPNTQWEPAVLAERYQIVPQHHRLFSRLLAMLAEAGIIRWAVGRWLVIDQPTIPTLPQASRIDPAVQAEWTLLERCGSKLAAILQGRQDPVALLFPDGDDSLVSEVYQESPSAVLMNQFVQAAVTTALAKLPADRGIRILEIGAGTGSTTASILPHLPTERTEYTFTDIGAVFLTRAQERFKDVPFIQYAQLDIEQSPREQGFAAAQYDIVVAANVFHAAQNLRETVTHARQLLKPGGLLLLLEDTARQRWVDLTFGLTEGWWRFTDLDLRPDHPLLPPEQWRTLLQETGFETAVALPGVGQFNLGQSVIMAQADTAVAAQSDPWLIFADESGLANSLVSRLRAHGERVLVVSAGAASTRVSDDHFTIRPDEVSDYRQLFQELPPLRGVVYLWGLNAETITDGQNLIDRSQSICSTVLHLVQALTDDGVKPPNLWLVTWNAQAMRADDGMAGVVQSQLWGMGKVIAVEHPELRCARVDLAIDSSNNNFASLADDLLSELLTELTVPDHHEDQLLWHEGSRYAARLIPHQLETQSNQTPLYIHPNRTYLLTGGLGGLGLAVAAWLVQQGARHLVLLGRRQPSPAAQQQIDALAAIGVQITVAQADVTDGDELAHVLQTIPESYPLAGVIHGAGVLDDGILRQQSWQRFATVLAPKVQGAWHLHQLTKALLLDFFVLFSSATALLGNGGQANHAAANAFLDALAHYRHAQGLPALSINWGAWSEIGAAADRNIAAQLAHEGIDMIAPEQGIATLAALLNSTTQQPMAQVGVIPMVWSRYLSPDRSVPPFLRQFRDDAVLSVPVQSAQQQLRDAADPYAVLTDIVLDLVTQTLGWSSSAEVGLEQGFFELGMDSLMSLELRRRLQRELDCELPSTLTFAYPSVKAVVDYLAGDVLSLQPPAVVAPVQIPSRLPITDSIHLDEIQVDEVALESWVEELTESEVDTLLDEKLDQIEQWLEQE